MSRKITLPGIVIFRDNYTRTEHICNQATLQISSVLRCISSTDEIKDFECHLCCHRKVSAPLRCSSHSSRSQPLSRASGHKRYNTLDFPSENRVPSGTLFPSGTPCQQAISHAYWTTRSQKESASLLWKPPGISFAGCAYKPIISVKISGSGNEKSIVFSLGKQEKITVFFCVPLQIVALIKRQFCGNILASR